MPSQKNFAAKPWFIHDVRWSVLCAPHETWEQAMPYCAPKLFRCTTDGLTAEELDSEGLEAYQPVGIPKTSHSTGHLLVLQIMPQKI
ncbi:hypothetical protein [Novipirellula maiorica]|uniref:hypothetical protein n=1 Tax=Novipirellula maiorica TaxID=1265734 RepID=UPI000345DBBE|nr:hypothetical protein [Rhodopirellula maiorica]